ncbi:arylesterase [Sphingobacterium oryzagri]|uniref:Arylesterase n=1 Tax=Sphingobacterium oryzagri TaxID=3025669 RepID=A0ABY7WG62_9SPHI|nr:arylesterase [Sphingobacterium sp. KACC 22765]WDF67270.1 arylesterase [Sphingobacterium sp. KACC 22765]
MNSIYKRYFFLFVVIFSLGCSGNQQQNTTNADTVTDNVQKSLEQKAETKNILFFGNSLTAGYGLENPADGFPGLIQNKIDSLNLPYACINAGLSGETSAGGNERIDWLLKNPVDIFVLELGANDGLRGVSPETTFQNLSAIIEKVKKAYPTCQLVLAGMLVPPNVGKAYYEDFKAIFPRLAEKYQMKLIPFLLDGVAGDSALNQGDGIHPTKEGQIILAENVWQVLQPLL